MGLKERIQHRADFRMKHPEVVYSYLDREADLEVVTALDELEKYKKGYEAAMRIVRATYPDKFPGAYFIASEGGPKDINGLPEQLHICPAIGCDWFMVYKRTDDTWGPEW